jgi:hypothetical protein
MPNGPDSLSHRLELVLETLRSANGLSLFRRQDLPSHIASTATPDPFHSDDFASIGGDHPAIVKLLCKAIEIALGQRKHQKVTVEVREETLRQSVTPIQVWVLLVQRKGRRPVYIKGLFVKSGRIHLISLHESDRA